MDKRFNALFFKEQAGFRRNDHFLNKSIKTLNDAACSRNRTDYPQTG
ncbi:hypothetical protein YSA_05634 [Pseudomonas putida ND6]|uniref:Uncharacterized protein n=1 Tax=Pseudomonas putida ND6 TaxID=231023 RepID=I3UWF1_PSEPU|nr:hypothetical protein YSA_05634 [Pseudomonas putida ND6]